MISYFRLKLIKEVIHKKEFDFSPTPLSLSLSRSRFGVNESRL